MIIENFGDAPFFKEQVPAVTIAAMTACAVAIRAACPQLELGINVLRNDGAAALAIAAVVGAACVRVNVLSGARVTDQGLVEGRAAELLRLRQTLGCPQVELWADVAVKHSAPLAAREIGEETRDLVLRALADAVLVTGSGTGEAVDTGQPRTVAAAAGAAPVYVAGQHRGPADARGAVSRRHCRQRAASRWPRGRARRSGSGAAVCRGVLRGLRDPLSGCTAGVATGRDLASRRARAVVGVIVRARPERPAGRCSGALPPRRACEAPARATCVHGSASISSQVRT